MEKNVIILALILMLNFSNILLINCENYSKTIPYKPVQEKQTNLHFYVHDTVGGKNPTAIPIAPANTGPQQFGTLLAVDDPITIGPELTSQLIGNARGMYLHASQSNDMGLVVYWDMGFTSGEFNGSSLSVFSRNPILESPRELAVVGGRGQFRFARGFITVKTVSIDANTAVLEYNVQVVHP